MKIVLAVLAALLLGSTRADDKSHQLDRQIIRLLLEQSELVVLCHKDVSGDVGMDQRLKTRYGLTGGESGFGLPVKETIIGPAVKDKVISFWFSRKSEDEPFFVPQGDYLLFLKHDAQNRWALVGDFMGLQPCPKGLDMLVKEIHEKMR